MKLPVNLHKLAVLIIVAIFLFMPTSLSAEEKPENDDASAVESSTKKWGIRPDKRFLSEFTLLGGNYLGDEWQNTWDIGGYYSLYFNTTFGIGGGYLYSPMRFDGSSTFGLSITKKAVHVVHGELIINNDCSIWAGDTRIQCDLYFLLGGGKIQINRMWKPLAVAGGGMHIFTPIPWFAIRIDVLSLMHPTPNPIEDTFNADISTTLGLSFFVPMKMNPNAGEIRKRPTLHHRSR